MTTMDRSGLVLTDKVVLITGASKGIGSGCARVFVDAGAKVMICARHQTPGVELAQELTDKGPGECVFQVCDVSKPDEVRALIDSTVERFGRLDCLINNAGFHPPQKGIDTFDEDDLAEVWQANFVSQFVACKHALSHLRRTKGSIVNMGSLVARIGQEGGTTYCATKGAISAFTKALAIEEARNGVRVNAVLPGNILSDSRVQAIKNLPEREGEVLDRWVDANQHMGRSGTNEETGQVCLFLASDAASYLTGIEVVISGGAELGYGTKYPTMFV